jgi:hypothetical protein
MDLTNDGVVSVGWLPGRWKVGGESLHLIFAIAPARAGDGESIKHSLWCQHSAQHVLV